MSLELKQIPDLPEAISISPTDLIHIRNGGVDKKISFGNFLNDHLTDFTNPHNVTKAQLGLANISGAPVLEVANNLSDVADATIARSNLNAITQAEVDAHANLTNNPHNVTKSQLGLGNLTGNPVLEQANNLSDVPNKVTARANLGVPAIADLANAVPSGVIMMWSGSIGTIPTGYALCDGTNGTPNLSGRFVVAAKASGDYQVGETGGSTVSSHTHTVNVLGHKLTWDEIPPHQHDAAWGDASPPPYGANGTNNRRGARGYDNNNFFRLTSSRIFNGPNESHEDNVAHTHIASASNSEIDTTPPYYALAYIMKL